MDATTIGVLSGGTGAGLSILSLGKDQYNRWRDRKDKNERASQDAVTTAPDRAVTRLSEALDQLAEENARVRSMNTQMGLDMDRLIGENRALRQETDELRIQCNMKKRRPGSTS